jgi:hypothetical protein
MRGKPFHNLMAQEIKTRLDRFFEQVESEYPIRRNGVVTFLDLFAHGPSRTLAVEVETTQRHALDNARKAAAVEVPLWIVVPTRVLQSRLLQRLEPLGLQPGGQPICVLMLGQLEQGLTHYLSWRIEKTINKSVTHANRAKPQEVTMKIMWENILPLVVVLVLIVLLIKLPILLLRSIGQDIMSLGGRGGNPVMGLVALAIICVTVIGIFRIISNGRR